MKFSTVLGATFPNKPKVILPFGCPAIDTSMKASWVTKTLEAWIKHKNVNMINYYVAHVLTEIYGGKPKIKIESVALWLRSNISQSLFPLYYIKIKIENHRENE